MLSMCRILDFKERNNAAELVISAAVLSGCVVNSCKGANPESRKD